MDSSRTEQWKQRTEPRFASQCAKRRRFICRQICQDDGKKNHMEHLQHQGTPALEAALRVVPGLSEPFRSRQKCFPTIFSHLEWRGAMIIFINVCGEVNGRSGAGWAAHSGGERDQNETSGRKNTAGGGGERAKKEGWVGSRKFRLLGRCCFFALIGYCFCLFRAL